MDLSPRGHEKVARLIERGVSIPAPATVDIGDDVDLSRIADRDVVIYPGCRIYGAQTVISAGVRLGAEGPVTVEDCYLGPRVELKGGYLRQSVFLEKAGRGEEFCVIVVGNETDFHALPLLRSFEAALAGKGARLLFGRVAQREDDAGKLFLAQAK